MLRKNFLKLLWVFLALFLFYPGKSIMGQSPSLLKPVDYFGFTPGTDRMLLDYEQLIGYLQKLDAASPMMKIIEIGKSPMGKPMYIAFFSSEKNIQNLDRLKEINRELALNPNLSKQEQQKLVKEGKVFFVATLSMHSSEVGPSQAAPLIAFDLLTTQDPKVKNWLDNVVYMMVPCHNPDGMDLIVNNYRKYKGTKYEGASLPRVYNKYVGHDNNRDFVILSQQDTRNIQRIFTQTWFPQVMVEKHQMGSVGPRYFVPPNSDPIAENIDAKLWTWMGIFGQNLINDMTNAGLAGVSQHYEFDNYWPGSTETCLWQNVISFLTECASARYATPIYVEPNELRVGGKGLAEYKKSINMPLPWKGGWWRLGDIMQYEIISTKSIIKTASVYHDRILKFRNDICRKNVALGKTTAPYYYIMPLKQHDESELVNLVNLLGEQGVNVYRLDKDYVLDGRVFHGGDMVVPLAQPFRSFIKEVMEKQTFPVRHYTINGPMIRPYDITTWSLPLQRHIDCYQMDKRSKQIESGLIAIKYPFTLLEKPLQNVGTVVFPVTDNESFKMAFLASQTGMTVERTVKEATIDGKTLPAGSFVITAGAKNPSGWDKINKELKVQPILLNDKSTLSLIPFNIPRIALIETYYSDMDAGWTRYIFDTYHIPYTVLHPDKIPATDLNGKFDVIVFPGDGKTQLLDGASGSGQSYYMATYPPEYSKGMGKKGLEKLMAFLDNGGLIVSWGSSTGLFEGKLTIKHKKGKETKEENFRLPFRDISSDLQKKGLYIPGSLIRIDLKEGVPLTYGLSQEIGVFSRGRPVFATSIPYFDMDRRVFAWYPEENALMSGYAEHPELMANKAAVVWLKKGKGQMVLMGFNPQFRASTQASFKLLFNALLLPSVK